MEPSVNADSIGFLSFGQELLVKESGAGWCKVRHANKEGYVRSLYIATDKEFSLLMGIFANEDARNAIFLSRCRRALINYFEIKNYAGKADDRWKVRSMGFGGPAKELWQVSVKNNGSSYNTYFYLTPTDKQTSSPPDFAVLIKRIEDGERRLLVFKFDGNENLIKTYEQHAPKNGEIIYVRSPKIGDTLYAVKYSTSEVVASPNNIRTSQLNGSSLRNALHKRYNGSIDNQSVLYDIYWFNNGGLEGSYFFAESPNFVFQLKGKGLGGDSIELEEYTNQLSTARFILVSDIDCWVGKVTDIYGVTRDIRMCDSTVRANEANDENTLSDKHFDDSNQRNHLLNPVLSVEQLKSYLLGPAFNGIVCSDVGQISSFSVVNQFNSAGKIYLEVKFVINDLEKRVIRQSMADIAFFADNSFDKTIPR